MTKKPTTRLREAVQALAAIPDPAERAIAAGDMAPAAQEAVSEISRIRQNAIKEMRAAGLSHRVIGERLGIHFTRVAQLEKGDTTGRRKKAAVIEDEHSPPAE